MANVQQIVRDYLLRARSEGVAQVTADAQRLGQVTDTLAVKTETVGKASVSAAAGLERQQRQLDMNYRSMKQFDQAQRDLDRARQQGLIGQARHNELLALATQRYGAATNGQRALSVATQDFQSRLAAATGATGTLGGVLSAFGPIGIGVAAGIGAAVLALNAMSTAAHTLAEKAQELRRFSEVTGLTTAQVQALRSEASKFGVTSDEAQTAIQNFTARFNDLRIGQGELLTQIRRVNPALADQMASVTNAGDALTMFGQALSKVDDVFQRNALVKAATGRGGIGAAQFLASLNVDKLTESYIAAGKGIDENLIKKTAQLEIDIKKTSAAASQAIASIFSESVLQTELAYQKGWLDFANSVKSFTISGDLRFLLETVLKIKLGGQGTLLGAMGIDYEAGYKAPILTPRRVTGPESLAPLNITGGSADRNDPSRRELAATAEYTAKKLQEQIAAMGDAATMAQKLDLAQQQLAISGKAAGLSTEQLAKANEILKGSFALQQMQATITALGAIATPAEQLAVKVATVAQELAKGAISQETFNRAIGGLRAEASLDALREMVSTLGAAATPAEQLKLKFAELEQKLAAGKITLDTFNRSIADFQREQDVTKLRDNVSALGSAATSAEQYKLRLAELQQQLDRAQISQETFNRAVKAADPVMQTALKIGESFAQTLLQVAMGARSMSDAFKSLGSTLASDAIRSLFKGNLMEAGLEAIGAAIMTGLGALTDDSKEKEMKKLEEAWRGMRKEFEAFLRAADGFDLNPMVASIIQIKETADQLWMAATKAGDAVGAMRVFVAFVTQLNQQIDKFANPQIGASDTLKQITDLQHGETQLIAQMKAIGYYSDQAADSIHGGVLRQIVALKEAANDKVIADINAASGNDYLNDLNDLFKRVAQMRSEGIVDTRLIDRIFAVGAQKIVDGTDLIGDSFNELLSIYPDLTGVIHASTQAMQEQIDEQKRLADEQKAFYDGLEKDINDFIRGVKFGNLSTLSPSQQFAAAQADFQKQSSLALVGDRDAQSSITKFAQTFLEQSRSFLGPSQAYGSIEAQVIATLNRILGVSSSGIPMAFAGGGMIGNGIWNQDSVRASYAGGGNIMLAGGEFVNRATSVTQSTLPMLQYINQTGQAPANDNGAVVAEIRAMRSDYAKMLSVLVRLSDSGNQIASQVVSEVKGLRTDTRQTVTEKTVRQKSTGTNG